MLSINHRSLINAQGIKVVVPPQTATTNALTHTLISAAKTSTPTLDVGQLPDTIAILTMGEVTSIVSMSDLSFVKNISDKENMELVSKVTHNIYHIEYLFSLITVGG